MPELMDPGVHRYPRADGRHHHVERLRDEERDEDSGDGPVHDMILHRGLGKRVQRPEKKRGR